MILHLFGDLLSRESEANATSSTQLVVEERESSIGNFHNDKAHLIRIQLAERESVSLRLTDPELRK